jgi:ABC-type iron transport system FetAB ATPase subunit
MRFAQAAQAQRGDGRQPWTGGDVAARPLVGGEAQTRIGGADTGERPEALLLDEPTSALDEVSARGVRISC